MGFQRLLGSVAIVVEELLAGADRVLGHQDQSGDLVDHHHLGQEVGTLAAVVDQPTVPPRLCGGVNTEQYSVSKMLCIRIRLTNTLCPCARSSTCNTPC